MPYSLCIEECLQYYNSKADGFRHVSLHTNKIDCEKNQGYWVSFSNYLEEYPKYQTKKECENASSDKLPLKWAIPYRSEDIDNLKIDGDNVESLKRCLVALALPECKKTPHTRTNHLGNAHGVVPIRYNWVIPHFPSGHIQRCVLRLRFALKLYTIILLFAIIIHVFVNHFIPKDNIRTVTSALIGGGGVISLRSARRICFKISWC